MARTIWPCAIESALSQTYPHYETIVVNDGSTDGGETERIALSFGNKIRYFAKANGGVASAVNLGIRQMRGDYFCWLSHDDYYHPDKVLHELQTIPAEYPETLIYSDYIYYDTVSGHQLPVLMEKWFTDRQLSVSLFPVMFQLIHGSATLIHRSHFDRVGLFDEAQLTTQDYDMWFRVFRNAHVQHCAYCDMTARLHPKSGNQSIPEFIDNASAFWIRVDQMLTDAERAEISGTPHRYYQQMYGTMENTKYEEAKRYYCAALEQNRYSCHCRDADGKRALLRVLETNCGIEPQVRPEALGKASGNEAELDAQIRQRMEQYYRMPENRTVKHIWRPQWSLGTRLKRSLLCYGWKSTIKRGWNKLSSRIHAG